MSVQGARGRMQAVRAARRHAARSVARVTSGGGLRCDRAAPARGRHAGVEEEEGTERGADELPAQEPGRGVADHVGRVADRLDLLPGRDRARLAVPAEYRRDDERGRAGTPERGPPHEDEDRFLRAPMPRAGGGGGAPGPPATPGETLSAPAAKKISATSAIPSQSARASAGASQ